MIDLDSIPFDYYYRTHAGLDQLLVDVQNLVLRHEWLRGKPDEAQDIAQEAALEVLRRLSRGKTTEELRGCIGLIAESTRQNWFRKRKRRRPAPQCDHLDAFPARSLTRVERQDLIEALSKLPKEEIFVVYLIWFEGLTTLDVAKILGINRETVSRRRDAAIQRLARLMGVPQEKIEESPSTSGACAQ